MIPVLRSKYSKRAVADEIADLIPPKGVRRFVDALALDASVLPHQPRAGSRVVLNTFDTRTELFYLGLRDNPEAVIEHAQQLWGDPSKEEFTSLIMGDPSDDPAEAAAETLFLNQLSVPGTERYDSNIKPEAFNWDNLHEWSQLLQGAKITLTDEFTPLWEARKTDLVYLDTQLTRENTQDVFDTAAECHGMVILVTTGNESPETSFDHVELTKCRPGNKVPDLVWFNWAKETPEETPSEELTEGQ